MWVGGLSSDRRAPHKFQPIPEGVESGDWTHTPSTQTRHKTATSAVVLLTSSLAL